LFTSLVMLPAMLAWLTRSRPVPEVAAEELSEPEASAGKIRRVDPAHHPGTSGHARPTSDRVGQAALRRR
jgi:hypothetical protein